MQIPSTTIAASVSSLSSGKTERNSVAADAPKENLPHVEGLQKSDADRDAQGQGDGLSPRGPRQGTKQQDAKANNTDANSAGIPLPAPTLPGEPPSQIDLVG